MLDEQLAISILMATYNRADDLRRVLQAYDRQRGQTQFEILVADDASPDHTPLVLQEYRSDRFHLRFVRLEKNSGPGQARNRLIPMTTAPLVLFTGDDMLPEVDFVESHLAAHRFHANPKTAILGRMDWPKDMPVNTMMAHIDGVGAEQFSFHFLHENEAYDFRHFYTSNVSLKREMLFAVERWFDPDFALVGYEDAELGYRLAQQGMEIRYTSVPQAYHYHYHTIYTFARRQYASGLNADLLVSKHPQLERIIYGRSLKFKLPWLRLAARMRPVPAGTADHLEEICLRLGSFYEWQPHAHLDPLYSRLLRYFFVKGILSAKMANSPDKGKALDVYTRRALLQLLNGYLPLAERLGLPLPAGYQRQLLAYLALRQKAHHVAELSLPSP